VWSTNAGTITGNVLTAQTTPTTGKLVTATVGSISGTAVVQVVVGPPVVITVTPDVVTVSVGMTQAFTATGTDGFGNIAPISPTWSTDAGTMMGNILTAQATPASGRHVTATVGSISGTAIANIVAGPLASITVTPNPVAVAAGATQPFTATGVDAAGNILPISPTWSTDAGTMAGNVLTAQTTPESGRHVMATVGSISGTAVVNVVAGPPHHLTITPTAVTLAVLEQQQFSATGYDVYSNVISGLALSWQVMLPDAGTINSAGLFTAGTKEGDYLGAVRVSSGAANQTADVTVYWPYRVFLPVIFRNP
jgi:uncharacterized protein YcfJ